MVLIAVVTKTEAFYANQFYKAMKGAGTDDDAVIRAIGALNRKQLKEVNKYYTAHYGNSLKHDLKGDLSGDYLKLVLELVPNNF